MQVLINSKGMKMDPFQSLYYVSPACLFCLIVPLFAVELPGVRALLADPTWTFRPSVFLANAFTAFLLNLAVFLLIGKTSALTMNIAGVIKDWTLIYSSYSVFKAPVTALNLAGTPVFLLPLRSVAEHFFSRFVTRRVSHRNVATSRDTAEPSRSVCGTHTTYAHGMSSESIHIAFRPRTLRCGSVCCAERRRLPVCGADAISASTEAPGAHGHQAAAFWSTGEGGASR